MTKLHPESQAIDRVGIEAIMVRFDITRQAVHYWRRKGVPNEHRRDLIALGKRLGHDMQDIKIKAGRKRGRPPTSAKMAASSAVPA